MESVADAINANTVKLAKWLESHPAVKRVHWAYSEKSAGHYAKIARGPNRPGSLFTIELNGPIGAFYDRLRCAKGPSFGTTFTIVCPFAYLAHYDLVTTAEGRRELLARDLDPELIRIAVGAEPFEDIRAVFEEALG
jgi:cystathionine gamma-synthase